MKHRPPHKFLFFEDIQDNIPKAARRVRGKLAHDQRMQVWKDLAKQCYNWTQVQIRRIFVASNKALKRRFVAFKKWKPQPKVDWKWVLIAFLLGLLFVRSGHVVAVENPPHKPIQFISYKPIQAQEAAPQAQAVKVATQPPKTTTAPVVSSSGSHEDWMAAAGISPSDYGYVDYIVSRESTWSYTVVNYLGATGLCQSLPGNKMAAAGADWQTNPITQLRWCNSYAQGFGGWAGAYNYWVKNHYW